MIDDCSKERRPSVFERGGVELVHSPPRIVLDPDNAMYVTYPSSLGGTQSFASILSHLECASHERLLSMIPNNLRSKHSCVHVTKICNDIIKLSNDNISKYHDKICTYFAELYACYHPTR